MASDEQNKWNQLHALGDLQLASVTGGTGNNSFRNPNCKEKYDDLVCIEQACPYFLTKLVFNDDATNNSTQGYCAEGYW